MDYIQNIESGGKQITQVEDIMKARDFEELRVDSYKERTRAYLKIQEGCSQFCTYCIIPYARGPIRSRPPEDVLKEVRRLAESGFKEVVLTGIHVASYGKDLKTSSLMDIIRRVHEVDGIERIRLGSIEPTTLTEEFITVARDLKKLCPHYHVSLQSGCDATLKRMNRKYTTDEYRKVIARLRENIADVAVTTDVMAGFPGETEEEFEQTYRFLEEIVFAQMHVFKYSPRKGTPAAAFEGQVSPQVKEERSNRLIELSKQNTYVFNRRYLGKMIPVLFEQEVKGKPGFIEGLTPNYIKVVCRGETANKGRILDCKLVECEDDYVIGDLSGASV